MIAEDPMSPIDAINKASQAKGLGGVIASWIGTGQNLPVSAAQIQSVLGGRLGQAASLRHGLR